MLLVLSENFLTSDKRRYISLTRAAGSTSTETITHSKIKSKRNLNKS